MSCRPNAGRRRCHHRHQHHQHQYHRPIGTRANHRPWPPTTISIRLCHRHQCHTGHRRRRYHHHHHRPISAQATVAAANRNQCPARAGISSTGRPRTPNLPARSVAMMSGYRGGRDLYSFRRMLGGHSVHTGRVHVARSVVLFAGLWLWEDVCVCCACVCLANGRVGVGVGDEGVCMSSCCCRRVVCLFGWSGGGVVLGFISCCSFVRCYGFFLFCKLQRCTMAFVRTPPVSKRQPKKNTHIK